MAVVNTLVAVSRANVNRCASTPALPFSALLAVPQNIGFCFGVAVAAEIGGYGGAPLWVELYATVTVRFLCCCGDWISGCNNHQRFSNRARKITKFMAVRNSSC